MSILTPHEILLHLGFKIPEKGVTINPYDRLLHIEGLKLLGKTMNVEGIPKEDLIVLRDKLALEFAKQEGKDSILKRDEYSEDSVEELRAFIDSIIRCVYKA